MSRDQKLHKLRRAVLDWRGSYVQDKNGKRHAVKPPQKDAAARVARWLKELGMDVRETAAAILACKTHRELDTWFAALP